MKDSGVPWLGKVAIERPLRLKGIDTGRTYSAKEIMVFVGAGFKPALDAPPVIRAIHRKGAHRRTLEEIRANILALEKETEGMLDEIIGRCSKP
ncbi:MAG: hypothetical protein NTV33_01635 [Coprothermobacterota bacterium]|nr:hypothetical protein [Coprothermobacterota bacterium]